MKARPFRLLVARTPHGEWSWNIVDEHGAIEAHGATRESEAECREAAQEFLARVATNGAVDSGSWQPS